VYQFIRENGGWNNWSMIEFEKFSCNDGNEARARERYWYEELRATLNMDIPNRTMREWKEDNAEKIKEQQRQYNLANPEIRKNTDNRRRTKKLSNGVYEISKKELKRIYSSPCFYCGSTNSIHADHVIPISKGGRHSIGNLLPACAKCNMSKGSKLLIEWRGRKSNLK
jgi:5-methylcytosine-specific restriction endonuclease McrA